MSYSTDLFCNVHFPDKLYDSIHLVESDLEDTRSLIKLMEDDLLALAVMTEPQKMYPLEASEDGGDLLLRIRCEVREKLRALAEYRDEETRLQLLLDNWGKCHDDTGAAMPWPDCLEWDSAFIDVG